MKRILLATIFVLSALGLSAQGFLGSGAQSTTGLNSTEGYHYVTFNSSFNLNDGFIGGMVSINALDDVVPLNINLSYAQRPRARRTWSDQGRDFDGVPLYYQLRERRFQIGLGAETYFNLVKKLEVYAIMQGGYLFGNNKAVDIPTDNNWVVLPEAGIGFRGGSDKGGILLRAGYAYRNMFAEDISPHRVKVHIGVYF